MKLGKVLPDAFLKALPRNERARHAAQHGKAAAMTREEASEAFLGRQERELQRAVVSLLNLREIYFVQSRMDKRTTNKKGTPDFICVVGGLALALECKAVRGRLSAEQVAERTRFCKSGGKYAVIYSLKEAIEAINDMNSL